MRTETFNQFSLYLSDVARLNGVSVEQVKSDFSVEPSIQQRLESKMQESSEFLKSINLYPVKDQVGETLGMGVSGPIAGTTDTDKQERQTSDISQLEANGYFCQQINYDSHIKYAKLDAWTRFPDFTTRLNAAIVQRMALDRIMMGFNGIARVKTSDKTKNPLLQDVAKGWLQKIRENAPKRWVKEGKKVPGKIQIGEDGDFKTLDALVLSASRTFLDPWFRNDTQLVAITGSNLVSDKLFPLVNRIQPPTEQRAAMDMIISQVRLGPMQAVQVPYFPENAVLITRLDNLSVYSQEGSLRRSVKDNSARDRIETFQSSNDDFVIEDYGCVALIENIENLEGTLV